MQLPERFGIIFLNNKYYPLRHNLRGGRQIRASEAHLARGLRNCLFLAQQALEAESGHQEGQRRFRGPRGRKEDSQGDQIAE